MFDDCKLPEFEPQSRIALQEKEKSKLVGFEMGCWGSGKRSAGFCRKTRHGIDISLIQGAKD
jgi:hypothetical protein